MLNRGALAPVRDFIREPRIENSTRHDPVNLAREPPVSALPVNSIAIILPIRYRDRRKRFCRFAGSAVR